MALPTTISDVVLKNNAVQYVGPFISAAGNVYAIFQDADPNDNILEMHKATDPTTSFSEVDAANHPDIVGLSFQTAISSFQEGDLIHIVVQSFDVGTASNVYYIRFDMSDDTWVDIDGAGDREVEITTDTTGGSIFSTGIVVLSTGKIRVVFRKAREKVMGTEFRRVGESNSTDGGKTWSAPAFVSFSGVEENHVSGKIVLPPSNSDQAIAAFSEFFPFGGDSPFFIRGISSGDTFRTIRDTGFLSIQEESPIAHSIAFLRSSTSKVRLFGKETAANGENPVSIEFDAFIDDTNPTFTITEMTTDFKLKAFATNNVPVICPAMDGSIVHVILASATDNDFYHMNDQDSDTWTTPVLARAGTNSLQVSTNLYTRSGTKRLAFITQEILVFKYDEVDIVAPVAPTGTGVQILPALGQSATGVHDTIGSGVQTFSPLSQNAVGLMQPSGVGVQTTPALAQSAVGLMHPNGVGVLTFPGLAQNASGLEKFIATAVQAFPSLLQSAAGLEKFIATAVLTLPGLAQLANGIEIFVATGVQDFPSLLQTASGTHVSGTTGTGVLAFPALVQLANGEEAFVAVGVQTLPGLFQLANGVEIFIATGIQILPALTQAGAGLHTEQPIGVGIQIFPSLIQAGLGGIPPVGVGIQTFPSLIQFAVGFDPGFALRFGPIRIDLAPVDMIEVAPDNVVVSEITIGITRR